MQKYQDNLAGRVAGALVALKDIAITVTNKATGLPATLFSDDGVTPLAQPLTTDVDGYFAFYAANGTYLLSFSGPAVPSGNRTIELYDADDAPPLTLAQAAASDGSSKIGHGGRTLADKLGDTVSVKDFGAKGDGLTDDTAAIQAALNSAATHVHFPNGSYRIVDTKQDGTPTLLSTVPGRRITSTGALTATTPVLRALKVQGNDTVTQMNVVGNANIAVAVSVSGDGSTVEGCNIANLSTNTFSAVGIEASTTGGGIYIRRNIIRNLVSNGDGTLGNGNGMARGISLAMTADTPRTSIIEGNVIESCMGEEGDSITIIASNGSGIYYNGNVTIRDNVIDTFSRRGVKIQASKCRVHRNRFTSSITDLTTIPNRLTVIDLVQGGDQFVQDNILDSCKGFTQINAWSTGGDSFSNFYIERNKITGLGTETTKDGIFMSPNGSNVVIRGNDIQLGTGVPIAVGTVSGCIIESNSISCSDNATARVISTTGTTSKAAIRGNILLGGVRQCFIGNDALNTVATDNHVKANTPLFRGSSNCNALVANNSIDGTSAVYSNTPTLTGNRFAGNYNLGAQTNIAPGPLYVFGSSGPSVYLAGLQVAQGQVVFYSAPAAGGTIGWVAMSAGLAEAVTWKTFGNIAA